MTTFSPTFPLRVIIAYNESTLRYLFLRMKIFTLTIVASTPEINDRSNGHRKAAPRSRGNEQTPIFHVQPRNLANLFRSEQTTRKNEAKKGYRVGHISDIPTYIDLLVCVHSQKFAKASQLPLFRSSFGFTWSSFL